MFKTKDGFEKTDTIDIINQNTSELGKKISNSSETSDNQNHFHNDDPRGKIEDDKQPMSLRLRQSGIASQKLQAKINSLENTVVNLQNELDEARSGKQQKESEIVQIDIRLADLSKQVAQMSAELSAKKSEITQLQSEIARKNKVLQEKQSNSLNLKEMTEQALKAASEKVEQLESKLKRQRTKRRELDKFNKELEMKLVVAQDELHIVSNQVRDLQAIRKQGTDGLMSEYSENLSLRERM